MRVNCILNEINENRKNILKEKLKKDVSAFPLYGCHNNIGRSNDSIDVSKSPLFSTQMLKAERCGCCKAVLSVFRFQLKLLNEKLH